MFLCFLDFVKWSCQRCSIRSFEKYCTISCPCKRLCLQITAEVSKITENVQWSLTFIFIELSETANTFVKIRLLLEIKNVACFVKPCFYRKQGCIKMGKHAETIHTNKVYKLAIVVFIPTSPFSKYKFVVHFQTLFGRKLGLADLYFLYENELL